MIYGIVLSTLMFFFSSHKVEYYILHLAQANMKFYVPPDQFLSSCTVTHQTNSPKRERARLRSPGADPATSAVLKTSTGGCNKTGNSPNFAYISRNTFRSRPSSVLSRMAPHYQACFTPDASRTNAGPFYSACLLKPSNVCSR